MRLMAVRNSVICLPLRFSDAELAMRSIRADNDGSEPTTRTTCSTVDFESASTLRTRIAISGKDGKSTCPPDSSLARPRTKSNAATDSDGKAFSRGGFLDAMYQDSES